jgi:fucose 4-O-acetylase-like acetyltransferase
VLAVLAGYANDIGYYASLSRTIVFFPFFLAGYYFDKRYLERFFARTFRLISVGIIVVFFLALFQYGQEIKVQWFYGSFSYEALEHKEWFAGAYRIIIYLIAVVLSFCILILVPQRRITLISQLGQNTLYTYLIHGFIMKYLIYVGFYSHFTTTWMKGLLIIIGIGISVILSMNATRFLLKWIIEPKFDFLFVETDGKLAVPADKKATPFPKG